MSTPFKMKGWGGNQSPIKQNPKVNFKWRGQYIFRPKHQVPEGHFKKMVDAGVQYLIIGLETFSDRVRFDMDKKHTSADAEWHLEMFKKHGISCQLLMLTGWVTETEEDHKDTLSMFSRLQKYVASGTITGIELGSTLYVLDYTPVMAKAEQYGLSFINDNKCLLNFFARLLVVNGRDVDVDSFFHV